MFITFVTCEYVHVHTARERTFTELFIVLFSCGTGAERSTYHYAESQKFPNGFTTAAERRYPSVVVVV